MQSGTHLPTALEAVSGHDLHEKRAIVTGGAAGIGAETVRALAYCSADGRGCPVRCDLCPIRGDPGPGFRRTRVQVKASLDSAGFFIACADSNGKANASQI
jgi:hypothetical protein